MATWQFSMHLVPREGLLTVSPDLRAAFSDDDGSDGDLPAWTVTQPPADLVERLSRVLPEVECWDRTTRQFGPADGTTVQVSYEDGRVVEIFARIDLRWGEENEVIEVLASLAADSDGWWVGGHTKERVPIGQTSHEIRQAIRESDALRFVADPRAFLAALQKPSSRS